MGLMWYEATVTPEMAYSLNGEHRRAVCRSWG